LPWRHYHGTWSYWTDVAINVVGFIPFGFSIFGYFSSVRAFKHSAAITIALGFITSLIIEVSQALLPTRDSGVNDLITNTLGTAIGVVLYRSLWLQTFVLGAAFLINPSRSNTIDNIEVGSQV
jgi:glycopeptide antibiotics resistance protein